MKLIVDNIIDQQQEEKPIGERPKSNNSSRKFSHPKICAQKNTSRQQLQDRIEIGYFFSTISTLASMKQKTPQRNKIVYS